MISLGATYTDQITGFQGIAIGYVQYLTGCHQVLLQPRGTDASIRPECEWFDEQRLTHLGGDVMRLDNGATPGSDRMAPKR